LNHGNNYDLRLIAASFMKTVLVSTPPGYAPEAS